MACAGCAARAGQIDAGVKALVRGDIAAASAAGRLFSISLGVDAMRLKARVLAGLQKVEPRP